MQSRCLHIDPSSDTKVTSGGLSEARHPKSPIGNTPLVFVSCFGLRLALLRVVALISGTRAGARARWGTRNGEESKGSREKEQDHEKDRREEEGNRKKARRATVAKKKKTKAPAKKATAKRAASPLGCCTIIYDDHTEQVPNVTEPQCVRLGIQRGGTGQWNPGACA
ncbi:hypothetical protein [Bradyrhizobium embrapense]|uniref:hypothetical protein n=1 Tax=Bradyrhizobium embrapense TaxID=630921 RepID=UPI0012F4E4B5|nr:hypothetical protein [Bradyrhizobium embrapense]